MVSTVLLVLTVFLGLSHGSKILVLCPYKGHSHSVVALKIADALWERGHNVTVASFFPRATEVANYTSINLKAENTEFQAFYDIPDYVLDVWDIMNDLKLEQREYLPALKNKNLQRLTEEKFDLVIMEYFLNDMFFGLLHQIGAPFILVHTTDPYPWMTDLFNEPHSESFTPHALSLSSDSSGSTSFFSRLRNFVELNFILGFYSTFLTPESQRWSDQYFPNRKGNPRVRTVGREASLFFVNSHNSLTPPRPVLPSTIEIGGIHVSEAKPLQKELKTLMDNSKGVVFFSLGSVMRGHSLKQPRREEITNVFAGLEETVLWKWESDFPDKPTNVHTSKWFQQRDILAHPKTSLYIGHCGMLGLQEAVTESVPIICIPFFADQFQNAKHVVQSGMGLSLDWITLDEDTLRKAVIQVLREPRFKESAERVSKAFKDRPMTSKETVIYWSEYVIRHNGAPHIKSPARYMSWIEVNNADVIAALLAVVLLFSYFVLKATIFVLSSVFYL